ncbi:ZIP family metal transporter [Candidatus Woesearchaeota archaeon]|nr:ZIP family metal transporter [Candidatus Woesearchaeota archaeon]
MNLIGDTFHNLIDGLIIGASYLVSVPVGIASTVAIVFHEIPQEIGDFGVLLKGGYSKTRALFLNFVTALTSVIGVVIALIFATKINGLVDFLIPFAAGSFIYIAGSDLIPELHKEDAHDERKALLQMIMFVLGIMIMCVLLLLE